MRARVSVAVACGLAANGRAAHSSHTKARAIFVCQPVNEAAPLLSSPAATAATAALRAAFFGPAPPLSASTPARRRAPPPRARVRTARRPPTPPSRRCPCTTAAAGAPAPFLGVQRHCARRVAGALAFLRLTLHCFLFLCPPARWHPLLPSTFISPFLFSQGAPQTSHKLSSR